MLKQNISLGWRDSAEMSSFLRPLLKRTISSEWRRLGEMSYFQWLMLKQDPGGSSCFQSLLLKQDICPGWGHPRETAGFQEDLSLGPGGAVQKTCLVSRGLC